MVMSKVHEPGSLEQKALERKERLKALKQGLNKTDSTTEGGPAQPLPKPKFRSYKPKDETLKEAVLPDAPIGDVESEIKDQLEAANSKVVIEELDITNLAPRKPDWDLKRDITKKMDKLEKRTQKAIAELIWEKLKQGQTNDINAMVTLSTEGSKLKH